MESVIRVLAENPLLLLFVVAAIGYPLGEIKVGGAKLGVATVLFVGLGIGAIDPRLRVPDIVYLMGLALFIYTLGLTSARGFFAAFNRHGLRITGLVVLSLALAATVVFILARAWGINARVAAGLFSGSFPNASGLAGTIDTVKAMGGTPEQIAEPVVGYSLAYPLGILIPMGLMVFAQRLFRVNLRDEALTIPAFRKSVEKVDSCTILVQNPAVTGRPLSEVVGQEGNNVIFGRIVRDGVTSLALATSELRVGDLITAVGPHAQMEQTVARLGKLSETLLQDDRSEFDSRRIFVSKPELVGRPLSELNLPNAHNAVITRVRRGDMEFIPDGNTILELGDRVRVLTRRDNIETVSRFFGDSYKSLSEIDFLTLSLGMGLGLLLGLIPFPLPGGLNFRLGFAGGPLIVALIVGKLERTGPVVWNIPYSANLTLRQFGLIIFAAGIGLKAGFDFLNTLRGGEGLAVMVSGAITTTTLGFFLLTMAYRGLKVPLNTLLGVYAGTQTQPVNLSFAVDQTKNDLPTAAYATVFPIAIIAKIIFAQLLLAFV